MEFRFLPQEEITDSELNKGLQKLIFDGICSQIMGTLAGGAFLVAFALKLGASNLIIGIIAALGPLTQVLQLPAIFLVEKVGYRTLVVVACSFGSRLFWFLVAHPGSFKVSAEFVWYSDEPFCNFGYIFNKTLFFLIK